MPRKPLTEQSPPREAVGQHEARTLCFTDVTRRGDKSHMDRDQGLQRERDVATLASRLMAGEEQNLEETGHHVPDTGLALG